MVDRKLRRSRAQEKRIATDFGAKQHSGSGNKPFKKNDSHTDQLHIENKRTDNAKSIRILLADLRDVEHHAALDGMKIPVLSFELGGGDYDIVPHADLVALVEGSGATTT